MAQLNWNPLEVQSINTGHLEYSPVQNYYLKRDYNVPPKIRITLIKRPLYTKILVRIKVTTGTHQNNIEISIRSEVVPPRNPSL